MHRHNLAAVAARAGAAGAGPAAGSDWPVSSADPVQGMHVAVNRVAAAFVAGEPVYRA
jgi:hypothetical protein